MNEDQVPLREHIQMQLELRDRALILALETVKEAVQKDDRRLSNFLAIISFVATVALTVYTLSHK